jgi:hypothetical protein
LEEEIRSNHDLERAAMRGLTRLGVVALLLVLHAAACFAAAAAPQRSSVSGGNASPPSDALVIGGGARQIGRSLLDSRRYKSAPFFYKGGRAGE